MTFLAILILAYAAMFAFGLLCKLKDVADEKLLEGLNWLDRKCPALGFMIVAAALIYLIN